MKYLRQVWHDLQTQPVIAAVSVIGTALAIFLIMTQVMMFRVKVDPLAPESDRGRMLYGRFIHIDSSSGQMSLETAKRLYGNLEGAGPTAYCFGSPETVELRVQGRNSVYAKMRAVDDVYLRTFDYDWLAGAPFDAAVADAGSRVAVLDETRARQLFGSPAKAVGATVHANGLPYVVTGVIADVSALATAAFGEMFVPVKAIEKPSFNQELAAYMGNVEAIIPARSADDFSRIRRQTEARKQAFAAELRRQGHELIDHGAPFTQEEQIFIGSNTDSGAGAARRHRWLVYAVILLIPAFNLSSMTRSRLSRRTAEIGVRRAFGARRSRILGSLIMENLIVTLIGALLGLALALVAAFGFSDVFFADTSMWTSLGGSDRHIPLSFLLNWRVFELAILFSFVLNLISAGFPAWRASRIDPANALK